MVDAVQPETVTYRVIETERGDTMFRRPSVKWHGVMTTLLTGETVFVPGITRSGLETLRGMLSDRTTLRLRSRTVVEDDQEGYLLRLVSR
jgi:hypothetical protein